MLKTEVLVSNNECHPP